MKFDLVEDGFGFVRDAAGNICGAFSVGAVHQMTEAEIASFNERMKDAKPFGAGDTIGVSFDASQCTISYGRSK